MRFLQTTASKSAVVYVGTTLFCSLLGKVVITRFFFDYPIVILMLQMATTLFIIELLRVTGALKMAPYSFEKGRQCFFPSVLLCIAQWLTVSSFEGIGLPSLESIKRLTPVFIAVGMASQHQRLDKNQLIGITTISMASFLAVNLEMNIDRFSLFYGLISCVLQAVAYIQFESLSQTFQATELMYMHSFNSLIVFLIADIVQDEIRDAFMYMMTSAHPLFTGVFIILLLSGIIFQYATFLCLEHNGALNTQLISNVRAAVQIFLAYNMSLYLFYDVSPNVFNYFGLLASIGAAYYYYKNSNTKDEEITQKNTWMKKA